MVRSRGKLIIVACLLLLLLTVIWWGGRGHAPPPERVVQVAWEQYVSARLPPRLRTNVHQTELTGDGRLWLPYSRELPDDLIESVGLIQLAGGGFQPVQSWNYPGARPAGFLANGSDAVLAGYDPDTQALLLQWTATGQELALPLPAAANIPTGNVSFHIAWFPDSDPETGLSGVLAARSTSGSIPLANAWYFYTDPDQTAGSVTSLGVVNRRDKFLLACDLQTGDRLIQPYGVQSGLLSDGVRLSRQGELIEPLSAPPAAVQLTQHQPNQGSLVIGNVVLTFVYTRPLYLPIPYLSQFLRKYQPPAPPPEITTFRFTGETLEALPSAGGQAMFSLARFSRLSFKVLPDQSTLIVIPKSSVRSRKGQANTTHYILGYLGRERTRWEWIAIPVPADYDGPNLNVTPPKAQLINGRVHVHFWVEQRFKRGAGTLYTTSLDPWWEDASPTSSSSPSPTSP